MNQATNVNVVPSYGQRGELHFSQYDVGRTATINLYGVNEAFSIPASSTVKIQATKPSGLGFNESCTYSGNVVTIVCTATMTEEYGRFPCELQITKDSDIIGTANFMFCVEASPHPDGVIDGDAEEVVNEIKALVLQSEGYALGTQDGVPVDSSSPYYHNNAKWLSDNAVLSDEVKQTLLACFEKVAWIDGNGQTYYDALQTALNRGAELLSISAVYTQSGYVYNSDPLDVLKSGLVVTANYDDQTTETVLAYTLSGTLTVGTSSIIVSYGGKTTTFDVTVTKGFLYTADRGTLSEQTYFNAEGSLSFTESVSDNVLNISYTKSSSSASKQFVLSNDYYEHGVNNMYAEIKIKISNIGYYTSSNTSNAGYFYMAAFSTDSTSMVMGFARYNTSTADPRLRYRGVSAQAWDDSNISLNTWHTFTFSVNNGNQVITMDGSEILNTTAGGSHASTNHLRLGIDNSNTNDLSIQIEKIEVRYTS